VALSILAAGDYPTFVDVDPKRGCLDSDQLRRVLRRGAKALVLTHLFGQDDQFDAHCELARESGAFVIEDSALILSDEKIRQKASSVTIVSFGRGKPLPLGGGGGMHIHDSNLKALHNDWASGLDVRAKFTSSDLLRGALRDSRTALITANAKARLMKSFGNSKHTASNESFKPLRLSIRASVCVKHRLIRSSIRKLADETRAALECYRDAFTEKGLGISETVGFRLPNEFAATALAIRCSPSERKTLLGELASQWIDCPRYWQYCVGEEMSQNEFPGARQLADSLLFLPLHSDVDREQARIVARTLKSYRVHAFN